MPDTRDSPFPIFGLAPLFSEDNEEFEVLRTRFESARDAFFEYWQTLDPVNDVELTYFPDRKRTALIEFFDDWLVSMERRCLSFYESPAQIESRFSFPPIMPYVFIDIADRWCRDRTLLDYVKRDFDGTEITRVERRVDSIQKAGHDGQPRGILDEGVWSIDHIYSPVQTSGFKLVL